MKRRKFLRSLASTGAILPAANLLATEDSNHQTLSESNEQPHGCSRTDDGKEKSRYGVIARDFYDPYIELIRLLKEASEIEHSLMVQYIYAAFSVKPKYASLIGPPIPSSDSLLGVAIQEMQHLSIVNKLLVALGCNPSLDRQDFPYEIDIYPFPLKLERLTRESLARYTYVEAGRHSQKFAIETTANDQLVCDELTNILGTDTGLNQVAALYELIIRQLELVLTTTDIELANLDEWVAQLDFIMNEGETAHFEFFSNLLLGKNAAFDDIGNPWNLALDHPDYPSFDIETNPTAYFGHANQIVSPEARALAWLSNLHYWMVLMMLDIHYRTNSEALNSLAQTHMVGPLQSLANGLAEYGTGLPFDILSMGYSPAPDHAGNLQMIRKLSEEADTFAKKMDAGLPAGYPIQLHRATATIIDAEIKRLG